MFDSRQESSKTLKENLHNSNKESSDSTLESEILQDSATAETLLRLRASLQPEIVLYDMPPMLEHDDLSAFLPQLDGVLLISDGTQTMSRHLRECERMLEGQVPLLGIVLNRARASSLPKYA